MLRDNEGVAITIANNIKSLRKSKGLTQGDLANKLGYTVQAVSRWEKGKSLPDPIMLYRLAELFEVDVSYFYNQNHIEIEPEIEKRIKRRELMFRLVLGLFAIFILGLLAVTIIFLIDMSVVHILLWVLSFLAISILLISSILRYYGITKIFIPITFLTLVTSLYFSLKEFIPNLKWIFIPMVAVLLGYFVFLFFFNRKKI